MAAPSYEQLKADKAALTEENEALKAQLEAAQAPTTDGHADAIERVRELEEKLATLTAERDAATGRAQALAKGRTDPAIESGLELDGAGWPVKPELQDNRGTKTPGYLRWLFEAHPEIYASKRGGEPPQGD